jgi:hypothetical protein
MLALEVAIGNQNNPQRIIELAAVLEARMAEAKDVLFGEQASEQSRTDREA